MQATAGVLTSTQSFSIGVTDINDNAPAFTSSATPSVAENTTAVATLTTTDPDTVGTNPPTITITGGADSALFQITGGNQLSFVGPRDFETQAHSYAVQITANDGVNNTVQNITVALTDVNDTAPVFTSSATPSVAENTTAVLALTTTDADTVGSNPPTFTITGGTNQGLFTITGGNQLSFVGPRDFETQAHSYAVQVTANDGANTTVQNIAVTLTDVNDNAPVFSSGTTGSEAENTPATNVVYTAQATDADGTPANNTVHYALGSGGDNAFFNINANTGAVRFIAAPNAEAPQDAGGNNVYDITVVASDGLPSHDATKNVAITVTDVNDNAPVFASSATPSVTENTTAVLALTTTDADAVGANPPTFTITGGADQGLFTITGGNQLSFAGPRDFETQAHSYAVQVTANDGVNNTIQNITVALTDANDNAPVFTSGNTGSEAENTPASNVVYTAQATDADATPANNTVHYTLGSGGDNAFFNINANTGAVSFISSPDFEAPHDAGGNNVYDITVIASDGLAAHNELHPVRLTFALS